MKSAHLTLIALVTCALHAALAQQPQASAVPAPPPRHRQNAAPPPAPATTAPRMQSPAWRPPAVSNNTLATPRTIGGSNQFRSFPNYTPRLNTQPRTNVQRIPPWMQRAPSAERPNIPTSTVRTPTGVSRDTAPAPSVAPQPTTSTNRDGNWRSRNGGGNSTTSGTWRGTTPRDPNWRQDNPNWRTNPNWTDRNRSGSGDSRLWSGNFHDAYRRYDHRHHDRDWWRRHHTRIILVNGGYYYWDAGWWYPAWGYDPAAQYYAYDGPIYGYDGLPPDQVIASVQTALQQQGYYRGMVDGQLGPLTRQALADWQRDHGLAITTAIDYPTLASLGLA